MGPALLCAEDVNVGKAEEGVEDRLLLAAGVMVAPQPAHVLTLMGKFIIGAADGGAIVL